MPVMKVEFDFVDCFFRTRVASEQHNTKPQTVPWSSVRSRLGHEGKVCNKTNKLIRLIFFFETFSGRYFYIINLVGGG